MILIAKHVSISYSTMSNSLQPMDCSLPDPLSMEFSRQEYWSGLPFSCPANLPDPEIESRSPTLQADSLPSELPVSINSHE